MRNLTVLLVLMLSSVLVAFGQPKPLTDAEKVAVLTSRIKVMSDQLTIQRLQISYLQATINGMGSAGELTAIMGGLTSSRGVEASQWALDGELQWAKGQSQSQPQYQPPVQAPARDSAVGRSPLQPQRTPGPEVSKPNNNLNRPALSGNSGTGGFAVPQTAPKKQ